MQLETQVSTLFEVVSEIFEKQGYYVPTIGLDYESKKNGNQHAIVILSKDTFEKKDNILKMLGVIMGSYKAQNKIKEFNYVCFTSELYATEHPRGAIPKDAKNPSEDEQRKLMLGVMALDKKGEYFFLTKEIKKVFDFEKNKVGVQLIGGLNFNDKKEQVKEINNEENSFLDSFYKGYELAIEKNIVVNKTDEDFPFKDLEII